MRLGPVMLVCLVAAVFSWRAVAHPADEFSQVTLQITIDDQSVQVVSRVPARYASTFMFDGTSPIDLDRLEPTDLAKRVQPVVAEQCPLLIDGLVVQPVIIGAKMRMPDSRLPARAFSEGQVMREGELVFLAEYQTKGPPRRVSLDWGFYANDYDEQGEARFSEEDLIVIALVEGDGREELAVLSPIERGYTWHAEGAFALPGDMLASQPIEPRVTKVPVLSIALLLIGVVGTAVMFSRSRPKAAGLLVITGVVAAACLPVGNMVLEHGQAYTALPDDEALAVFESLHRNIYRAFDYADESEVYDALAQSVDGAMLETIYNDVYQSLIMREENNAVSKVVRVEVDAMEIRPIKEGSAEFGEAAYRVHCQWQVEGLVTHFGHSHARTNAFEAVYTVAPREQGWRIVDAKILQQQRVDDGTQTAEDLFTAP